MRILIIRPLIGRTSFELGGYCENALEKIGHITDTFEYIDSRISSRIPVLEGIEKIFVKEKLYKKILKFKPELILVIKGDRIPPATISQIRRKFKIPLVNYWIDDPHYVEISRKISPLYDYFFTSDADSIQIHKDSGCPHVGFLTFGCASEIHKKVHLSDEEFKKYGSDLCFCGTVSPGRVKFLESLTDFDIKIWTPRYIYHFERGYRIIKEPVLPNSPIYDKFTGRAVWGEELVKVYNATKIALNIHSPQACPIMRDFEVTGCGAFLLTDYAKGLAEMFKIGEEIICYRDVRELRDAIRFYLEHLQEREAIAQRGQKRTYSAHTYVQRMQELISFVTGE